jgi:hypothetical protein
VADESGRSRVADAAERGIKGAPKERTIRFVMVEGTLAGAG